MENVFNFEQASHADLLAEAKRLDRKLNLVEKAFANRQRQIDSVTSIITELIENDEISNEESVTELIDILGIEILKTVEFSLVVTLTGTTQIPMGTELDEYSFSIDALSYNGDDVQFDNDEIRLNDWNFTE